MVGLDPPPGMLGLTRRRIERLETKPYQQPKCCGLHGARLCATLYWPPTNQSAHPAFRETGPPAAAASLCSDFGQVCNATLGRIFIINKRLNFPALRRSVLRESTGMYHRLRHGNVRWLTHRERVSRPVDLG